MAVGVTACGGGGTQVKTDVGAPPRRAVGLEFVAVPQAVTALCRRAGQPGGPPVYGGPMHPLRVPDYRTFPPRFPIYCPARLPRGAVAEQNLAKGRTAYQWEVVGPSGASMTRYGIPHVVLGGQESPFPLRGARGGTWPPAGSRGAVAELRWPSAITVAGRSTVGGRRALALRFPSRDGPNGAHLAVVFNISGHGYFASVHFDRLSTEARIRLAQACAQWLERQTILPG